MLELSVTGMTCGHCVRAISEAVSDLPGVLGVAVDLDGAMVRIHGQPDPAAVRCAIEEEGFQAGEPVSAWGSAYMTEAARQVRL